MLDALHSNFVLMLHPKRLRTFVNSVLGSRDLDMLVLYFTGKICLT
jgi:hypothetical protein